MLLSLLLSLLVLLSLLYYVYYYYSFTDAATPAEFRTAAADNTRQKFIHVIYYNLILIVLLFMLITNSITISVIKCY